jgi:hypothetical protein
MKKAKILLSIIGIALATSVFGQLSFIQEKISSLRKPQVAIFTADNQKKSYRLEQWMYDLHSWATDKVARNEYEAPAVVYTRVIEHADVVFEEELGLEEWMTAPFVSSVVEEEMILESWMTTPFEHNLDEEIILESWMTTPFENNLDEEIILESWMTKTWI